MRTMKIMITVTKKVVRTQYMGNGGDKNSAVHGKRRRENHDSGNVGNKKTKKSMLSNQVTVADEYSGGSVTTSQGIGIGSNNRGRGRPRLTEKGNRDL